MSRSPLSRRTLLLFLGLCGALLLLLSLEALFFVKDADHFREFQHLFPETAFSDYLHLRLFSYLLQAVPVIAVALYTFFLGPTLGTPPLYRLIWGLLLGGAAALRFFQTSRFAPLSLIIFFLHIGLVLVIINIHRFQKEGEL